MDTETLRTVAAAARETAKAVAEDGWTTPATVFMRFADAIEAATKAEPATVRADPAEPWKIENCTVVPMPEPAPKFTVGQWVHYDRLLADLANPCVVVSFAQWNLAVTDAYFQKIPETDWLPVRDREGRYWCLPTEHFVLLPPRPRPDQLPAGKTVRECRPPREGELYWWSSMNACQHARTNHMEDDGPAWIVEDAPADKPDLMPLNDTLQALVQNRGLPAVLHTLGQLCGGNPRKVERW